VWRAGGDDSNNMIVPLDSRFEDYSRARGELRIEASRCVALGPGGARAGLHPSLSAIAPLFDAGALSIALNVGDSSIRPAEDHHDYSFLEFLADGYTVPKWAAAMDSRIVEERRPQLRLARGGAVVGRARRLEAGRPVGPAFPDTRIGRDLSDALGAITGALDGASSPLVVQVVHAGFDTHENQLARQEVLYREFAEAVAVFWGTVAASGLSDRVMLYTETEFSRTLAPNENGGTGHGWGGHVLMLGGPYAGGRLHGKFPSM
jgi:uncharacterized protein (DUF1501 family)